HRCRECRRRAPRFPPPLWGPTRGEGTLWHRPSHLQHWLRVRNRLAKTTSLPVPLLARPDLDLRCQGPVHGAFVGNLQEARPLVIVELARERDDTLDPVEHAFLGLAGLT